MAKAAKIDDVKRPDKVLPSATSRPILIADQSSAPAGDPMLAPGEEGGRKIEVSEETPVLSHTAKTVTPLSAPVLTVAKKGLVPPADAVAAPDDAKPVLLPVAETDKETTATPEPKAGDAPASGPPSPPVADPKPEPAPAEPAAKEGDDPVRDPEAAQTAVDLAAAEAAAKREHELENVIASGKYAVPINAVQRRRSRIATLLLFVLTLLLAGVLLDAVFDVGLASAPNGVPHTHLFSKK